MKLDLQREWRGFDLMVILKKRSVHEVRFRRVEIPRFLGEAMDYRGSSNC